MTLPQARTDWVAYQSFLLRLWRDDRRGVWHLSLLSTTTKQVHHFADVESLLSFLLLPTAGVAEATEAGNASQDFTPPPIA
jgi:hypothetical protein